MNFRILLKALVASALFPLAGHAATVIVSPTGSDAGAGTLQSPMSLPVAITKISAGDTILLQGGTYSFASQITIDTNNSGTAAKPKHLLAAKGGRPVLDFASQPYGKTSAVSNPRGIQINGSWWHLKGFEVRNSADNGIYVAGNDNVIEECVLNHNRDSGLQLGRRASTLPDMADWPARNLILNCEAFDNYDTLPNGGENADGFAAKLTIGPGNTFRGCISHHNVDDGWDLFTKPETGPIGSVILDRCIAHHNGTLTGGYQNPAGDKNGFKLGGSDMANQHFVSRCVAYGNGKNGFTWNSNPGANILVNNLAFDNSLNDGNFNFGASGTPCAAVFYNNVSFWTGGVGYTDKHDGVTDVDSSNCFWDKSKTPKSRCSGGKLVTSADFAGDLSRYSSNAILPRRLADSLPDFSVFGLSAGSDLMNAGAVPPDSSHPGSVIGYAGRPDLGVWETRPATGVRSGPGHAAAVRLGLHGQSLSFLLPAAGHAIVELLDGAGKSVATLMDRQVSAGIQSIALPALRGAMACRVRLDGQMIGARLLTQP